MEVFPPDDPQSNEVGSRPTVSQLEQIKSWDDSFANLESEYYLFKSICVAHSKLRLNQKKFLHQLIFLDLLLFSAILGKFFLIRAIFKPMFSKLNKIDLIVHVIECR